MNISVLTYTIILLKKIIQYLFNEPSDDQNIIEDRSIGFKNFNLLSGSDTKDSEYS